MFCTESPPVPRRHPPMTPSPHLRSPVARVDAGRLATIYSQTLRAAPLWAPGVTGAGVGIAILETGVDESGGDFRDPSTGSSRVIARTNTSGPPPPSTSPTVSLSTSP